MITYDRTKNLKINHELFKETHAEDLGTALIFLSLELYLKPVSRS